MIKAFVFGLKIGVAAIGACVAVAAALIVVGLIVSGVQALKDSRK